MNGQSTYDLTRKTSARQHYYRFWCGVGAGVFGSAVIGSVMAFSLFNAHIEVDKAWVLWLIFMGLECLTAVFTIIGAGCEIEDSSQDNDKDSENAQHL